MSYQFYDDTQQTIGNKQNNKKKHVQNPEGTKEFRRLNDDDIFVLDKISVKECHELQAMRNRAKLKQDELAKKLFIPESVIKNIEAGKLPIVMKQYKKIHAYLTEYLEKMQRQTETV